jgi:CspA family cold shock protein
MSGQEFETVFTGVVAWFNTKKGFGFIVRDDGETDIFAHYSDIAMEGYKIIMAGDKVSFEEGFTFKDKLKATNIMLLERRK